MIMKGSTSRYQVGQVGLHKAAHIGVGWLEEEVVQRGIRTRCLAKGLAVAMLAANLDLDSL